MAVLLTCSFNNRKTSTASNDYLVLVQVWLTLLCLALHSKYSRAILVFMWKWGWWRQSCLYLARRFCGGHNSNNTSIGFFSHTKHVLSIGYQKKERGEKGSNYIWASATLYVHSWHWKKNVYTLVYTQKNALFSLLIPWKRKEGSPTQREREKRWKKFLGIPRYLAPCHE